MNTPHQPRPSQTPPPNTLCLLLKRHDAARMLQLSIRKLYEIEKQGLIPTVRIGRAVRYDPADLATYIASVKAVRGAQ